MKVQYCSDLHLEFPENKEFLTSNPIQAIGDILILAGDIVPFRVMEKHNDFFDYVADNFEFTYWIPGNHEYYYSDASMRSDTFTENIRSNIVLLNNQTVVHQDVRFIFSTLWSKISPAYQFQIERGMSDFHVIKYNEYRFSVDRFNQLHSDCLGFIQEELNQPFQGKSIVVTHHAPTFVNYPEKHKGDILNEAFAVELYDLIEQMQPDYWIYGHLHAPSQDLNIGKTQLLTNQLGYVHISEHIHYQNNLVIEV